MIFEGKIISRHNWYQLIGIDPKRLRSKRVAMDSSRLTERQPKFNILYREEAESMGDVRKDRLITPDEAAERLAVSSITVKRWLRQDKLKGFKVFGSGWRIRETDLDSFIERNGGDGS